MRLMRLCAATVLLAGATTAAMAQPPGGGRGGMWGGGVQMGPANLVASKTVLADLKATDEQVEKLKTWSQEYNRKQFEGMRERFQEFQGLDPAEMRTKMAALQAENAKKAYDELATVLKPEQVSRLKQIVVQAAGPQAFAMPEVVAALKPTDEQKDKLKDATDAYRKEVGELRQEMGLGFGGGKGERPDPAKMAEFQKKNAGMTKELMSKVSAMLTDDQKAEWKKLTGETVDMAKIQADMPRPQMKKKDD